MSNMATTKPKTGWRGIHSGHKRWLACLSLAATAMAQSSPTEVVLHNFASSGEFVGDLTGLAEWVSEESEEFTAGGIKGPLLLL